MKILALSALLLALVLTMLPVQLAVAQVEKNKEECDPVAYLTEAGEDLQTYGNALVEVDYTDARALYDIYVDVMEARHTYEDKTLCEDLKAINDVIVRIMTDIQDTLFFAFAAAYDPANELEYADMITEVVQPRNTTNIATFSELSQTLGR
jgi:hypothetical protein